MLYCPNCNSQVDGEPVHCEVCGYRSDSVREYFWLYLGGGSMILLGWTLGAAGVLMEGAGPEHWSRDLRGWFPLEPWPESHHWLAFLVVGILLTMGGLGITRRRPWAWLGLVCLVLYEIAWSVLAVAGRVGPEEIAGVATALLAGGVVVLVLLVRIGLALKRTPERDASRMQRLARTRRDTGTR